MDTTTNHLIPFSEGDDAAESIDDTMEAMAERLEDIIVAHTHGTLAARPVSTPESPGVEGRVYRVSSGAAIGMVNYDTGTSWVTLRDPTPSTLASRPSASAVPAGTQHTATNTRDTSVSDGTEWLTLTPAARCSVIAATAAPQSVAPSAGTVVTMDESHDVGSDFSSGVLSAPVDGLYQYTVHMSASLASGRFLGAGLIIGGVLLHSAFEFNDSGGARSCTSLATGLIELLADAQVRPGTAHNNTGNCDVSGVFSLQLVGQM